MTTVNDLAAGGLEPLESPYTTVALSTMRRTVGRRLVESKQQAPHFYVTVEVDLDALLGLRAQWKAAQGDVAPTVNDCIVKAAARALVAVPALNAAIDGDHIRQYSGVNVGVAVAIKSGLVVPVIRCAERLDLAEIARTTRDLADRARSNKLTPDDYRGGTFTVSNLGMLGVSQFIAILNPPQAGILALGAATPRPVVRGGSIVAATILTATLSADHRVVDGAVAAEYLRVFREALEQPDRLLQGPSS